MRIGIIIAFMLSISITCYAQKKVSEKDLAILKKYMSGVFDSKKQSQNDSNYFEIHLHMKPIWAGRTDGFWLYVEQAIVSALDKPYRQRVYNVKVLNDSTIVSKVYTFKGSGLRFAGEWKKDKPLSTLTIDSLEDRTGCSIYLHKKSKKEFYGNTNKNDCESNLRGAKYATSKVVISAKILSSWDQGFDSTGKQVWGATKGGYLFVKSEDY